MHSDHSRLEDQEVNLSENNQMYSQRALAQTCGLNLASLCGDQLQNTNTNMNTYTMQDTNTNLITIKSTWFDQLGKSLTQFDWAEPFK